VEADARQFMQCVGKAAQAGRRFEMQDALLLVAGSESRKDSSAPP